MTATNKSIVTVSPPNLIGQVSPEFRLNDFEASIWNKGYDIYWERACECPCKTRDNQPLLTCQNCLGKGWFFVNPVKTKAIMHSINKDTKYKEWSPELLGTASLTVRESEGSGLARIGFMDRVTMINKGSISNSSRFSEVLRLRDYGSNKFLFLSYEPISVIDVWQFNTESSALIRLSDTEYSVSDQNEYVLNISKTFDSSFNGYLSVQYEHKVQYHVIDLPHDIRNSYIKDSNGKPVQIQMPVNAIIRRSHNVFEKQNSDGTGLIDNSYLNVVTPPEEGKWVLDQEVWNKEGQGTWKKTSTWKSF